MTGAASLVPAHGPGQGTGVVRRGLHIPLLIFLIGSWALDLHLPELGVNVRNLILMAACGLATALAVLERRLEALRAAKLYSFDWAYLAYVAFAAISALWSPSPLATAVQAAYVGAVWVATYSLRLTSSADVLRRLGTLALVTAIVSFTVILLAPDFAFQAGSSTGMPELKGIFSHQLRLGLFMSIAVGCVIIAVLNGDVRAPFGGRWKLTVTLGILGLCLIAALARLYTATMVASLGIAFAISRRGLQRTLTIALVVTGLIAAASLWQPTLSALTETDADLTLTGRTVIWARAIDAFSANPWLGHGYASFDNARFDWIFPYYRPAHPHNSFIQAFFETGYVGLMLTVLVVWLHLRTTISITRRRKRIPYSLYLVLLTSIGSLFGSNYAGKPTLLLCVTLLMLGIETREAMIPDRGKVDATGREID